MADSLNQLRREVEHWQEMRLRGEYLMSIDRNPFSRFLTWLAYCGSILCLRIALSNLNAYVNKHGDDHPT